MTVEGRNGSLAASRLSPLASRLSPLASNISHLLFTALRLALRQYNCDIHSVSEREGEVFFYQFFKGVADKVWGH